MKKANLIILLLLLIGGTIFFFGTKYGFQAGGLSLGWSSDKHIIERQTHAFMEDAIYKDFAKAAKHHHPSEQSKADIPKLIEEKFRIKPEQMDISEFEVIKVEVDSTGTRGRALTRAHVKLLNTQEVRDVEAVYFWHKWPDGNWYLQLRSSLE